MKIRRIPLSQLLPTQITALWELYSSFYDHVNEETFRQDLANKDAVYVGFAGDERIVAFSTTRTYLHESQGQRVAILFTGDTVVHPDFWGTGALHRAIALDCLLFRLKNPFRRCYWNLIASGNRTYSTLCRNFPTYWPRYDRKTPHHIRALIESIGGTEFPGLFNPRTGVVEMKTPTAVFKERYAPFDPATLSRPEIAFFVQKNPGFRRGDELVCLGEFDAAFVLSTVKKCLRRALPFSLNFSAERRRLGTGTLQS